MSTFCPMLVGCPGAAAAPGGPAGAGAACEATVDEGFWWGSAAVDMFAGKRARVLRGVRHALRQAGCCWAGNVVYTRCLRQTVVVIGAYNTTTNSVAHTGLTIMLLFDEPQTEVQSG